MTDELSSAIDKFFSHTEIQTRHYGVPKLNIVPFNDKVTHPNDSSDAEYTSHYSTFLTNLNQLSYLHELKQLKSEPLELINIEYDDIVSKLPIVQEDVQVKDVIELLHQLIHVKTDLILNSYLQLTVPILRTIHSKNPSITTSEVSISNNLALMFSKDNSGLSSNINMLIKDYKSTEELIDKLTDMNQALDQLYDTLGPELKEINELGLQIKLLKSEILIRQADLNMSKTEKSIRKDFNKLINNWSTIISLSNFLPNFIMCLPVNWFEDKVCLSVIKQCGKISEQFDNYLRIINRDNIKDVTLDDLMTIYLDSGLGVN